MAKAEPMHSTKGLVRLPVDSVYASIRSFIDNKKINSANTASAYETDIRQFFLYMRGKELEQLEYSDLVFKHSDVINYQNQLALQYSHSTVNRKIASLKALYNFFERDNPDLRSAVFDVQKLKEQTDSYGSLTWDEVRTMIDLAQKEVKGYEKGILIEFAAKTSIRLGAIASLKWSDIKWSDKNSCWVVTVYDKGTKKDEKPIANEFYQRMLKMKDLPYYRDSKTVFTVSRNTIQDMMKDLSRKMGIEDRNIVFHSLKKVAINWALETTGDIILAAKQGNHSSIQTTYKHYTELKSDLTNMPGLLMGEELDLSILNCLSKEELLEVIAGLSHGAKAEIISAVNRR